MKKKAKGREVPRKLVCLETYWSDRHVQAFRERSVRPFFEGLAAQLEPPLAVAHRFMDSPAQLAAYTRRKEGLLWRYPAGLKMNELSRHLMVTGGNVTGIVDPLEQAGLVERSPEPADRRAYRVRLTRAGRKAFAEMARTHEEWIIELLAGFSRKEHAQIYKLLGKVKRLTLEARS